MYLEPVQAALPARRHREELPQKGCQELPQKGCQEVGAEFPKELPQKKKKLQAPCAR